MKKLAALALTLILVGCATLDPGADPFVVRVEQGLKTADATFTMVLNLDHSDRGFWRTNAPAFHNFCERLRTPVPYSTNMMPRCIVMQLNVNDLKIAYKSAKTEGNSNALYTAWSTLSAAITQSRSWQTIITAPVY